MDNALFSRCSISLGSNDVLSRLVQACVGTEDIENLGEADITCSRMMETCTVCVLDGTRASLPPFDRKMKSFCERHDESAASKQSIMKRNYDNLSRSKVFSIVAGYCVHLVLATWLM